MATTNPVFRMSDNADFDQEIHSAQVLPEPRNDKRRRDLHRPPLIEDISCFSGRLFKPAKLQRSSECVEKRRSQKKSLFFSEKCERKHKESLSIASPAAQSPYFKHRSELIYMNDVCISRSVRSSGSRSNPLIPMRNGEAEIPYVQLKYGHNLRLRSPSPIYLAT